MRCSHFRQHISALVDQQLPKALQTPLEKHLDHCESCNHFFLQCKRLKQLFVQVEAPHYSLPSNILASFKNAPLHSPASALTLWKASRYVLAALVLLCFGGYTLHHFFFLEKQPLQSQPLSFAQEMEAYIQLTQNLFLTQNPFHSQASPEEIHLLRSECHSTQLSDKTQNLLDQLSHSDSSPTSTPQILRLLKGVRQFCLELDQTPLNSQRLSTLYRTNFEKAHVLLSSNPLPRQDYRIYNFFNQPLNPEQQQFMLAKTLFNQQDYSKAVHSFKNFRKVYPTSKLQGRAQFLEALAMEKMGNKEAAFRLFIRIEDPQWLPLWKLTEYESDYYKKDMVQIWFSHNKEESIPEIDDPLGRVFVKVKKRLLDSYKKPGQDQILCLQSADKSVDPLAQGEALLTLLQQYPQWIRIQKVTQHDPQLEVQRTSNQLEIQWEAFYTQSSPQEQQLLTALRKKAPHLFIK
jgi:TolA-binding protein